MTHLLVIALLIVLLIVFTPIAWATIKPLVAYVLRSLPHLMRELSVIVFVLFWGSILIWTFFVPLSQQVHP